MNIFNSKLKEEGYHMNRIRSSKILRVAAYIRVSHNEQKLHGLSLDAQKMKLTEYAKKHGMKIVEWYMDEGVSGRKLIRKRPELQRMIIDAENGKFDRIIFIKLDRFFRSVAEYHECMKRIAPVLWTTTEEEYDLSTANGRMLVNMKLTIAEMEADQGGERIDLVNEYKVTTGQPLTGNYPFCFKIATDEATGRKKVIKHPDYKEAVEDGIQYYLTHQSKRGMLAYLKIKYNLAISYKSIDNLLPNTMLYGLYRGNPNYCEPYIDKATFDRIQEINKRNIKENTQNRTYIFSSLLICPKCGRKLAGHTIKQKSASKSSDKVYEYKKYACMGKNVDRSCTFNKVVNESVVERMMLKNIEEYLEDAKIRVFGVEDTNEAKLPKYDIDAIHEEIDRLNYAWQKGRIRTVEQYEEQYAALMKKLEKAEEEQGEIITKDFSKVEAILQSGWKDIYNNLEDEYKRAFWRSFIRSIEINWTTELKEIVKVNFL